jgi:uncharacterized protein YcbK (DUF882 family)
VLRSAPSLLALAGLLSADLFFANSGQAASLSGGGTVSKTAAARPTGKVVKAAAAARSGKSSAGRGKTGRPSIVVLYHVNRHETMRLQADGRGRLPRGVQGSMDRFLRCHYTNRRHAMNPRLTRLLYETGRRYPGRRIEVVSGYRDPKYAKNPRSPHKKGLACDVRVAGVDNTELRDYFRRSFSSVGVGYYPNSSFVHLDVRKGASAFWIDYSGPGEQALYSESPAEDLRSGRAENWKRTIIDPSWADEELASDVSDELAAGGQGQSPATVP